MNALPFAATTPVSVASVGLKARDGERLARFYADTLGLAEIARGDGTVALGAGGRILLEIEEDPAAVPDDAREAGLFHTAFLLPARADLARWALFARDRGVRLDGASDHLVSEALYLSDPEGNGIEVYADRAPESWRRTGAGVEMATRPLDFQSLAAELSNDDPGWRGAPEATVIGHVHLRVGDPGAAEDWWREAMGFAAMAHYGDRAVFLSSGGYHHHIGANSWHSADAGPRDPARAGLSWIELQSRTAREATTLADPWGTAIRVRPA